VHDFFAVASSWSPDGRQIVLTGAERPWLTPSGLYIVDADGSGLRRVQGAGTGFDPAWRPR
jgi:Tol biopolymer transport system component